MKASISSLQSLGSLLGAALMLGSELGAVLKLGKELGIVLGKGVSSTSMLVA
jgi:hypothetical protein